MSQERFQANLSLVTSQIITVLCSWPKDHRTWEAVKNNFVYPAVYGTTGVILTGAVKAHFFYEQSGPINTLEREKNDRDLLGCIAKNIDASIWEAPFIVEEVAQRMHGVVPSINLERLRQFLILTVDLSISARGRRPLIVHYSEIDNLNEVHDALINSGKAEAVALAAVIRAFKPVPTPSLGINEHQIHIRGLELLEELLPQLTASSEFLEYGEERKNLLRPSVWEKSEPLLGLLGRRDRCLSRWRDFLAAHQCLSFVLRLGTKISRPLIDKVPYIGGVLDVLINTIDFAEYQPTMYVLPRALPVLSNANK